MQHGPPNVECLLFSEEQSSFLVGVAAALATKTKNVGFIGGVQTPLIQKFQAGFQAGVKAVDPSIKIQVTYLSQPPDFGGLQRPGQGQDDRDRACTTAAPTSSTPRPAAPAPACSTRPQQVKKLAIGVDSDQYQTAPRDQEAVILTSALKGVDTAVFNFIQRRQQGQLQGGRDSGSA